ncbi:nucleic acid binding OB-fold tRNA/helicase-type [Stanieria cyanosphaera PCC 7437]|uniref:Nucleic acid binding OB-fold tRNA/helicase-type n=1 Tax=Stanieria cyanosphaera (strain ATCC 29371 / PCC 7437) TaxID=111780 RepID=K9XSC5_STAC7|nr:NirD/YgiW/YdeI family stress tolerance protein [Stanieria cyanosphaera]AFZ35438.1 nucleic acid binding OB-fold tRNA/helicase-type [Stanieria cyanosphaera PCC 7437]
MKLTLSLLTVLSIVSVLTIPTQLSAQTPIENLKSMQGVTISGQVESVVGNNFTLNDGTGEIIVDAGPRWWHQIDLNTGESVTVVGEMGRDEFDAFSITRENGEVIDIRPSQGPPPWSGGNRRDIQR